MPAAADPPPTRPAPSTLAAQAGGAGDRRTAALVPPVHPSTTFLREADGTYRDGRGYARADSPAFDDAERLLTQLEGAADTALFGSGMAAITAVFMALQPGDHVVVGAIGYWGLRTWLSEFGEPWGLDVEYVDATDLSAMAAAVRPGRTRLVWVETPANPTWDVVDLAAVADLAHRARARLAVDSTVATPVLTRPIEFGADLVVHSATKYLNGHGDVLAGVVATAAVDPFWERILAWRREVGPVVGAFEAWLLLRGMRTLVLRVHRASASALTVAEALEGHPALQAVRYPGLASHPGHEVAARQMRGGFGGMVSIELAGGEAAARSVANRLEVFAQATSLGGTESLVEHRASVEGPSSPVSPALLRLSVGLEDPDELVDDLLAALDRVGPGPAAPSPPAGTAAPADDLAGRVATALREILAPSIVARGGALDLVGVRDGVVRLAVGGSPGAVVPTLDRVVRHLRERVAGVRGVEVEPIAHEPASTGPAGPSPSAAEVQSVLDERVNPLVAAHDGRVEVTTVVDGVAEVRLGGRCTGCTMAEITVRQGVEPILRDAFPGLVGVADVTDHAQATDPWFRAHKR